MPRLPSKGSNRTPKPVGRGPITRKCPNRLCEAWPYMSCIGRRNGPDGYYEYKLKTFHKGR